MFLFLLLSKLIWGVLGLAYAVLILYTVYQILTSNLPSSTKILWALVVFFLSPLGVILYYLIGAKGQK